MAKIGLGIALMLCAAAQAAEPPAPAPAEPAVARPVTAPARTGARDIGPALRKPLDLRLKDVRDYMMPEEYRAVLNAADPDKDTIVVEGTRLLPMERIEDVPMGPMALWYAVKHPANAWRIFAPVVNVPPGLLEKPSPVPPPVFRWGP
jgi:hypothetical protein